MRAVIVAAFVAFALTMALTPLAAKAFRRLKAGQPIRTDGPQTHLVKAGTPTMGGVVFIVTTVLAYIAGHLVLMALPEEVDGLVLTRPTGFTATGIVLIGLFVSCGFVGFIDDWLKIRRKHSGGISGKAKVVGLSIAATIFGVVAVYYTGSIDTTAISETVATPFISFTGKDVGFLNVTKIGMVVVIVLLVNATANGVNLTDGLDGLATGASMMAFLAFLIIGFWQYRHWCGGPRPAANLCYDVRDPLELALIAGAAAGAMFGFLWWNTSPAQIFMGDSGSLSLGALIAGLAIASKTILLLPIIGALFVICTASVMIQVTSFKLTGRRVFRMSPIQHHFELAGWSEVTIVVRFWIISGIGVAIALGFFFADFLRIAG
ncbi:phospho-N-acetylmuramoyl-pentapeptide-transferase [Glycomyces sp. TRM65418]|uniref:phospho-N-acetylmuramoyl-pentapeptide- transferase n=1 Tax=Glycomyces sp. TRM65418 TaxID=2867006 RepID=UPI001CE6F6F6|nr:phospho-N-acetylmuramoyl-pentapeptide-transferase [Glycomyces sp. TRM65418]MCC3762079.1 phospho-N-acetylmuramoyl-pentapeptide-transferase [Glycomyces sp. TRM65418]QZD56147.1 phospho-N-acetylmuramoyl-pentapeptide-transferase [Glycomyces sp. TRM65418]